MRYLDVELDSKASREYTIDLVGLSWGLTTIGTGKTPLPEPNSDEAVQISTQAEQMVKDRRRSVSNDWMKRALQACGIATSQAIAI